MIQIRKGNLNKTELTILYDFFSEKVNGLDDFFGFNNPEIRRLRHALVSAGLYIETLLYSTEIDKEK